MYVDYTNSNMWNNIELKAEHQIVDKNLLYKACVEALSKI